MDTTKPIKLKQLAAFYGVNRRTVESWMRNGLDAFRMGKLIYFYPEEVERFKKPVRLAACDGMPSGYDRSARASADNARKRFKL